MKRNRVLLLLGMAPTWLYTSSVVSASTGLTLAQSQIVELRAGEGWTVVIFDDGLAGDAVDMDLLDDLNELVATPLTPR